MTQCKSFDQNRGLSAKVRSVVHDGNSSATVARKALHHAEGIAIKKERTAMNTIDESVRKFGDRVGYSASDLTRFSENDPRVRHIRQLASAAGHFSIVAEIVQARHCNSGYRVGDRFVLDADGNLITTLSPKKLCVYAVSQLIIPVALINERLSEGLDPNEFHFMHYSRCLDVGVECSGYGGILMKVEVVRRDVVDRGLPRSESLLTRPETAPL